MVMYTGRNKKGSVLKKIQIFLFEISAQLRQLNIKKFNPLLPPSF